jgi:hypothetical protein
MKPLLEKLALWVSIIMRRVIFLEKNLSKSLTFADKKGVDDMNGVPKMYKNIEYPVDSYDFSAYSIYLVMMTVVYALNQHQHGS